MPNNKARSFWNTDLDKIEATFLPSGESVVNLPSCRNSKVPSQGSVIEQAVVLDERLSVSVKVWLRYVKRRFLKN